MALASIGLIARTHTEIDGHLLSSIPTYDTRFHSPCPADNEQYCGQPFYSLEDALKSVLDESDYHKHVNTGILLLLLLMTTTKLNRVSGLLGHIHRKFVTEEKNAVKSPPYQQ